jgi:hypothetical protein
MGVQPRHRVRGFKGLLSFEQLWVTTGRGGGVVCTVLPLFMEMQPRHRVRGHWIKQLTFSRNSVAQWHGVAHVKKFPCSPSDPSVC